MNILNIIQCTDLGGTEQASYRLMTGLKQRGHSCRVLSLNPLGRLAPVLNRAGIPAEGLPYRGPGGLFSMPPLIRKLRAITADGLMMTGPNFLAMAALGHLCEGRRILAIHFHHSGEKPAWQWRLIYRLADRCFQAITFPSDFVRREAESLYPPIAAKSRTIRNPILLREVPTEHQRRTARESLGIPTDARVIGNAGWLIPRKRFDVFLRVAAKVCERERKAICLLAGDGPERMALVQLSRELGIADRVRWLGWQEDLTSFYSSLDVLLMNSDWEALSMTALEAMSYGVPVVASILNGGLTEIVEHGAHGFLFASHDVEILTDAVHRSLADEGRRVGIAGREHVKECCDFHTCVASVDALLSLR